MRITVELGRPSLPRPRTRRLVIAAALITALAVPAGAAAIVAGFPGFNDVPPSNPFYAAVNALAGAGITTGCGSGNFCPTDNITRQAEAAFVNRGMPRVALATTPIASSVTNASAAQAASVTITVGGLTALYAGAQQFVEVHGHVALYGDGTTAGCPCNFAAYVTDENANESQFTYGQFPAVAGYQTDSGDVNWVFPAAPGSHTYTLWVITDASGSLNLAVPTLIASSLPFGDTGANTLTPQAPLKKASGPDAAKASH